MIKTDVLILGGGLAGLSAAYHLNKISKFSSLIVEKESRPGGTASSISKNGFTFDFTGHLLHLHDPYGKAFIEDLLKGNLRELKRSSWIYSHEVLTRYPFQANTYGLPDAVIDECLFGFLKTIHAPRENQKKTSPISFKDWALKNFGEGICEHFLFPYNEKLWQRPLDSMTTEWQGRFVPAPKVSEVLYGAVMDQKKAFGYNASFLYPRKGGIQSLPNALASRLKKNQLAVQSEVLSIDLKTNQALIKNLGIVSFKRLINTIPLNEFISLLKEIPTRVERAASELSSNSVYCLNLGVSGKVMSGKHWIYFPEKKYPFYRVGFYHQFSPFNAPAKSSSLYVEFSRNSKSKVDLSELESLALKGLKDCKILGPENRALVKEWLPISCGYVIYDFKRTKALNVIFPYLAKKKVESIGRYGAWKYSFMEEAIMDGKRCAEKLALC